MSDIECDVAIIGAGTAGLSAERRAREAGAAYLERLEATPGLRKAIEIGGPMTPPVRK